MKYIQVYIDELGLGLQVASGPTLIEIARRTGLAIDSECRRRGVCGKCRIRFLQGAPQPVAAEWRLLTPGELAEGWRLACQAAPLVDCRVEIGREPARAEGATLKVLTDAVAPRFTDAIAAMKPSHSGYGAAMDIGTTTVVCYLMDLAQARQIGVTSFANPQRAFGADVISRIAHAHRGERELRDLQSGLIAAIERHLVDLCREQEIATASLSRMSMAGNMTMLHLARGIDPWPLGVAPYQPVFLESPPLEGAALGFVEFAGCLVQLLPGVGGHLGSDITAGVTALGLLQRQDLSLFIDLGTNGEVVLCRAGTAVGATSAAGPAFEGVHIHSGMSAFSGAIERVYEEQGALRIETVDGAEAQGICGSGLMDVVELLLRLKFLSPTGRMAAYEDSPREAPEELRSRLRRDGHARHFLLHRARGRDDVILTQEDVHQVQLAKAPIAAAIDILLFELGEKVESIRDVWLAGAFGSAVRPEALLALDIAPKSTRDRIHSAGNTAGLGAKLALVYDSFLQEVSQTARTIRHVNLAHRRDFSDLFTRHISFP